MIVWLSAKVRKFEEGKPIGISTPDFTCIDDAISRLLVEYGALAEDFERPLVEKKKLLLEFLEAYPAFIVADDIDTLLDDPEVVSLFTYEIPQIQLRYCSHPDATFPVSEAFS